MQKCNDLSSQQYLAVSLYLKSMNKSQAATDAGYSTTSVFSNPAVKQEIAEQMKIRADRLRIGADWVLIQAVEIYKRCMQVEPVLNRDGNPTGEFKFNASGAIAAVNLVGRHVDVKAFDAQLDTHTDDEVMARLLRGRQRCRVDSSDGRQSLLLEDDSDFGGEPTHRVSFL